MKYNEHMRLIFKNKTLSGKLERSDSRRCKKEFGNRCKRQFLIIPAYLKWRSVHRGKVWYGVTRTHARSLETLRSAERKESKTVRKLYPQSQLANSII